MRSGFATFVGRPNVGKSTLVNALVGEKVSIVSRRPQTTRHEVRGILHRPDAQLVLVDTPGLHKPRSALGEHLNQTAHASLSGVDVVCLVIDATAPLGPGDRFVASRVPADAIVVVNKTDAADPGRIARQLAEAAELELSAYHPVSARTGDGLDRLVDELIARLPEGPPLYPDDMITDQPEALRLAELVREQLLIELRDEVPHSVATRVTEWDWPHVRCDILVERESQKGIVIGRGGANLKRVGSAVRRAFADEMFLELRVKVDTDWSRRPAGLRRLGLLD